jgi:hypothetical protein
VIGALERRILGTFSGADDWDESLLSLSARLQEDLLASSELTSHVIENGPANAGIDSHRVLAAVLARQTSAQERLVRGAIAFADLFGEENAARSARAMLRNAETHRARARRLLGCVAAGETSVTADLWSECASLPGLQRTQAGEIASLSSLCARLMGRAANPA